MSNLEQPKINTTLLWRNYKKNNDMRARELLIEQYTPLVKYVAGRLAMNMPSNVEIDDLESYGIFGLLDAIEKYDETRNVKFETYASTRIRGAIIDGLRAVDWVPRSVRSKARRLEEQIQELTNTLGRYPTDSEIAAALDVSEEHYFEMLDEVKSTSLLSLDENIGTEKSDDTITMVDLVADPNEDVDHKILHHESLEELAAAIDELSERERLVISLYYHDDLTLKEIGHILEVSESRISQIHTKAILTLRSKLR